MENQARISPEEIEISVVVPVYREEENVRPFLDRMEKVLQSMKVDYEILFCLDPSPDRTEEVIMEEINRNPNIKLIVFSRRFGQPAATMAGILTCSGKTCGCRCGILCDKQALRCTTPPRHG
jgi:dolichol-phosphate mannosyltransferase